MALSLLYNKRETHLAIRKIEQKHPIEQEAFGPK
jgi:hypothetical protein